MLLNLEDSMDEYVFWKPAYRRIQHTKTALIYEVFNFFEDIYFESLLTLGALY